MRKARFWKIKGLNKIIAGLEGNKGDKVNKPRSIDAFLSSTNYDELCGLHLFTDSAASTPSALLRVSLNGLYVDADFNAEFAEIAETK